MDFQHQLCIYAIVVTTVSLEKDCKFTRFGSTYRGQVAVTTSGKACQRWTSQSPHKHPDVPADRLPDASAEAAGNACRNPNMAPGGPWCYTTVKTTRYEYCPVPLCGCKISRTGGEYVGNQRVTTTGTPCQRWDAQTPHRHDYGDEFFPADGSTRGADNFCRNPDDDKPDGPWCFTMSPDTRWDYCDVPLCDCKKDVIGQAYTGIINVTLSGRVCQRWDSQTPHRHGFTGPGRLPDATLADASNYCRNPDNTAGPWCYTVDSRKRWEYCGVLLCEMLPTYVEHPHEKTQHDAEPTSFGCKLSPGGKEYQGAIDHTQAYLACQRWDAQTPHEHPFTDARLFPDVSVAAAADRCRNPGGRRADGPWCYTLDPATEWQYCPVQACGCKKNKAGWRYNGTLSNTVFGRICQRWDSQIPHNHTFKAASFPDQSLEGASNFCRNPGSWQPGGPWCFTTDPATRWQYCDVPFCECKTTVSGQEYGGKISRTQSGSPCQRWDAQSPHAHRIYDDRMFPDGSAWSASNFCRNPATNEMGGPWCYTQDANRTRELCDVPMCDDKGPHVGLPVPDLDVPIPHGKTAPVVSQPAGGRRLSGEIGAGLGVLTILVVLLLVLLLTIAYRQRHRLRRLFVKAGGDGQEAFDNPLYGVVAAIGARAPQPEGVTLDVASLSR